MMCPRCGAEIMAASARCGACGQSVTTATQVAMAVLTPLPLRSAVTSADGDLTRLPDMASAPGPMDGPTIGPGGDTTGLPGVADISLETRMPFEADDRTYGPPGSRGSGISGSSTGGSRGSHGMLTVGQRFGSRYQIVRLLGMGGMGAVYQAWDSELDVVVALKVILPEATSDPNETRAIERRFKQELLLARQVTHRNVVRIHDMGEIDGIKYITMSYIEGDDLATVLKVDGKFPVPAALRIMRQVVSGLVAAHEAGIVHRDLKPANIMIEGDAAVIMDFGIARPTSSPPEITSAQKTTGTHRTGQHLLHSTMAGTIVGTVAYMAPEQAKAEPVDQRADLYALGLIASDMLLGPHRRARQTLAELRSDSDDPPMPLRPIEPGVPEAFEAVVLRCLQRDPAKRYQTSTELLAALNRLDDSGHLLPAIRRLTPRLMTAAAVVVLAGLVGTAYVTRRAVAPPAQPDPVSVVIADLENRTGDAVLDRTLEPQLKRALEGAGFITAFDRNGIARTLGVRLPERLDETAAREIGVKQGLGVVLSGSIGRQGDGYGISIKAVRTVTGEVIVDERDDASSRDEILEVATGLMTAVRQALGDDESESTQLFAMRSVSATSLDVVREYAAAMDASTNNRFDEARQSLLKAVALDPEFGIGYQLLAVVSRNLGRLQDAETYIQEALRHLDGMTERERYSTRGFYYRVSADYELCVKEYGEMIARYAADVIARNQLALCSTQLRDMNRAVTEMKQVVTLLPNRALFRDNLALYASYAGDFATGEQEARTVQDFAPGDAYATLALAFAQVGQDQRSQAIETYQKLGTMNALGASLAASGLGDLAGIEGRFTEAVRILAAGASQDLKAQNADRAAAKFAALAHAELLRGQPRAAVAAMEKALANSKGVKIRFLAARLYVDAGRIDAARPLMASLAAELQAEPQAYAKVLEGEIALKGGDPRLAIKVLSEANMVLDTWIGHYDLGRAYLEAGAFPQADSEFDRCLKRRGEALSLFLDEEPTYVFLPSVYYYQGRVREGLNSAGFAESYRMYLAFRGQSKEDSLLPDVRRRAGG